MFIFRSTVRSFFTVLERIGHRFPILRIANVQNSNELPLTNERNTTDPSTEIRTLPTTNVAMRFFEKKHEHAASSLSSQPEPITTRTISSFHHPSTTQPTAGSESTKPSCLKKNARRWSLESVESEKLARKLEIAAKLPEGKLNSAKAQSADALAAAAVSAVAQQQPFPITFNPRRCKAVISENYTNSEKDQLAKKVQEICFPQTIPGDNATMVLINALQIVHDKNENNTNSLLDKATSSACLDKLEESLSSISLLIDRASSGHEQYSPIIDAIHSQNQKITPIAHPFGAENDFSPRSKKYNKDAKEANQSERNRPKKLTFSLSLDVQVCTTEHLNLSPRGEEAQEAGEDERFRLRFDSFSESSTVDLSAEPEENTGRKALNKRL